MTHKLQLETGHPVTADVTRITGDIFRFVNGGRTVFEIACLPDASLEIRSVEFHTVGDNILGGGMTISPKAGNSIIISTPFYAKRTK